LLGITGAHRPHENFLLVPGDKLGFLPPGIGADDQMTGRWNQEVLMILVPDIQTSI